MGYRISLVEKRNPMLARLSAKPGLQAWANALDCGVFFSYRSIRAARCWFCRGSMLLGPGEIGLARALRGEDRSSAAFGDWRGSGGGAGRGSCCNVREGSSGAGESSAWTLFGIGGVTTEGGTPCSMANCWVINCIWARTICSKTVPPILAPTCGRAANSLGATGDELMGAAAVGMAGDAVGTDRTAVAAGGSPNVVRSTK